MDWAAAGSFEGGELRLPNGCLDDEGTWLNTVELREIGGVEEQALTDKGWVREGTAMTRVILGCITRIGHYEDAGSIQKYGKRLTMADALYLLARLRQLSLMENVVSFTAACPSCSAEKPRKFDLSAQEVAFRPLDRPLMNNFPINFPGKEKYTGAFRILTLEDNPKMVAFKRENPRSVESYRLWLALTEFSGEGGVPPNYTYVEKWPLRLRTALRDAMESSEYGMDAIIVNECDVCQHTWKMGIPAGDPGFFFRLATPER